MNRAWLQECKLAEITTMPSVQKIQLPFSSLPAPLERHSQSLVHPRRVCMLTSHEVVRVPAAGFSCRERRKGNSEKDEGKKNKSRVSASPSVSTLSAEKKMWRRRSRKNTPLFGVDVEHQPRSRPPVALDPAHFNAATCSWLSGAFGENGER